MVQEDVIRAESVHEVRMPQGTTTASSTKAVTSFAQPRRQLQPTTRALAPASPVEAVWAEVENAWVAPDAQELGIHVARVTHLGTPAATRADFRGQLKALRAKNAEVRQRLNQVMAPIRQVMK